MKTNLKYVTYQSFPSEKANTIQTIDNVNYLTKYFQVELIFPLREKNSSDDMNILKNYYQIDENVKVRGVYIIIRLGKLKYFRTFYLLSVSYFGQKK